MKGYTIPIIDISAQKFRQTIVDREGGQYLGHPTTVLLDDGKTILCVYPKGHGSGQIVYKRSEDGGLHWSERLPVPKSWSSSLEVPTIYKTRDKDGAGHIILFSGLRPIRMAHSEDNGASWSELEAIFEGGGIVAMGDIEEVGEGEYIALFHDDSRFMSDKKLNRTEVYRAGEGRDMRSRLVHSHIQPDGTWSEPQKHWQSTPERDGDNWEKLYTAYSGNGDGKFYIYQTESTDGGLHWNAPHAIASHPDADICEPCIIRSPDGGQLCVLMRENSRKHNGFYILSGDNGKSWSSPIELTGSLTGDRHCARYLPDGRLFISFRDTTLESSTWGDWVGWVGSYDDIINGREGQYRVRIMRNYKNGDCAYPAIELLPDGTVVTTTYGHWTEGEEAYIMSVRFKIEELDAMYGGKTQ